MHWASSVCITLTKVPMSPNDAITDYHGFSGLNNTNLFSCSSGGQKSETGSPGRKSKCWQASIPPGSSMGESVPSPASSRGRLLSLAMSPFQHWHYFNLASTDMSWTLTLLPPSYKDLVITLGPSAN